MSHDRVDADTQATETGPVGRMRLMPSLAFGMRAAALTRIALPVGMIAASIIAGSPAHAADAAVLGTTCCPPNPK